MWIESALSAAAYALTVIGSLRAGSRAMYLLEHGAIGIMDGPLILPPTSSNGTEKGTPTPPATTLFELTEAFKHAVILSLNPERYPGAKAVKDPLGLEVQEPKSLLQRAYSSAQAVDVQPWKDRIYKVRTMIPTQPPGEYSLSIKPVPKQKSEIVLHELEMDESDETIDEIIENLVNEGVDTEQDNENGPRSLDRFADKLLSWSSRIIPKRKDGESDDEDDSFSAADNKFDWGYSSSIETKLRYNMTNYHEKPRVAELMTYASDCFRDLRSNCFGISELEFQRSFLRSGPFVSFQANSKGAARVGGVFFFTPDGAYMVKTIKDEEAKTLLKMLPKYHKHMRRYGRKSLLTRFCGMYSVRVSDDIKDGDGGSSSSSSFWRPKKEKLYTFIIMNAVFPAEASSFVSERFDLKGSTVGREVSQEEKESKGANAVMKDLDLSREVEIERSVEYASRNSDSVSLRSLATLPDKGYGLSIGLTAKAALLSQLRRDVKLLIDCQVMDYSLLVGVVDMDVRAEKNEAARVALSTIESQERAMSVAQESKLARRRRKLLNAVSTPIQVLLAPSAYVSRKAWVLSRRTVSSILTLPLPYYGSGRCGVNGGNLSVFHGKRRGKRAIYYMGLIDFLQPWTTRKVLERQLKGLAGYDIKAVSCVTPEEYAERFIAFLDAHLS